MAYYPTDPVAYSQVSMLYREWIWEATHHLPAVDQQRLIHAEADRLTAMIYQAASNPVPVGTTPPTWAQLRRRVLAEHLYPQLTPQRALDVLTRRRRATTAARSASRSGSIGSTTSQAP
ncbi:hypothetical protein ACIGO9_31440 [Nocardia asteroides]|uniref:hypothetical protein n=1 Tax=Nocardia asteroides TaxID=1824 RepID=UPI0037CC473E